MKDRCCIVWNRGLLLCLLFLLFFGIGCFGEELLPVRKGIFVRHTYYCLDFNKEHRQANWVYYELFPKRMVKQVARKDNFRVDPVLGEWCATLSDYRKSGYDRGHLCPAADMTFSEKAMSETFYLSNMSPQTHACNAGIWSRLEKHVRERAKREHLYVVTGPVFKEIRGRIGKNAVTVPGYFYKLFYAPERQQMIAYIIPNRESHKPLVDFAVPVDEVERLTGIDFFPGLPDSLEILLEADTLSHVSRQAASRGVKETASGTTARQRYTPSVKEQLLLALAAIIVFLLLRRLFRRKGKKKSSSHKRRSPLDAAKRNNQKKRK
ncbi:MAG: DNA/RNA non-specific endonuclease [Marinifilaceae bacterium]|nr:DNA/RNA non-specific endonuclease [Marinifilaceae bacterium]